MSEFVEKNTELLGVKVKAKTKESITEITEQAKAAGMIEFNGDIFDLFIERFQHDELSKKMAYGADLKELQQITRRINDIFINLSERNETNVNNLKHSHEEIVSRLNEEINELKVNKKELQERLTEKDDELGQLTNSIKVNQERIKELEEVQGGFSERIEEQKSIIEEKNQQIANKNELISQKEEAIAAMKEDIALNDELKKTIDSLKAEIVQFNRTIESKVEELNKQKEELEFICQKRLFTREQELIKQLQAEHSKEIREIQVQVNRYQEKHEKVLDEKDKLKSAQYELKVTLDKLQAQNEQKDATIAELNKRIEELEKGN